MSEKTIDAARFVEQAATAVGLDIEPAHLRGVAENFVRIHSMAEQFLGFPVAEEVEPAFVYVPSA